MFVRVIGSEYTLRCIAVLDGAEARPPAQSACLKLRCAVEPSVRIVTVKTLVGPLIDGTDLFVLGMTLAESDHVPS